MTLNATSGYSTQFEQFVQFAQASGTSEKTIARLGANTDLADRSIVAADKGKDVVGGSGAITINYASPEGCPVKFSWTATVDIDGRVTTTPKQVIG